MTIESAAGSLAVSLRALASSDQDHLHLLCLNMIEQHVQRTDQAVPDADLSADELLLRRAFEILHGQEPGGAGRLNDDTPAREAIARIVASDKLLRALLARRYRLHIRQVEPGSSAVPVALTRRNAQQEGFCLATARHVFRCRARCCRLLARPAAE